MVIWHMGIGYNRLGIFYSFKWYILFVIAEMVFENNWIKTIKLYLFIPIIY